MDSTTECIYSTWREQSNHFPFPIPNLFISLVNSRDENEKLIFSEYRRSRPLFDPWGSSTNLETGKGDVHPPEGEGQEGVQVLVVDLRAETDSSNNHIIQV